MRYYVDRSSYFDSHPYPIPKIKEAVKEGGGKNVRTSNNYGWSNQPEVVTFDATEKQRDIIEDLVSKSIGTDWIAIREKDW